VLYTILFFSNYVVTITDSLRGNQYEKPREHHKSLKIPKGIIRSRESKDKQYNDQKSRTKEKQLSTKHYSEIKD
jgi:hypothetical protein